MNSKPVPGFIEIIGSVLLLAIVVLYAALLFLFGEDEDFEE